MQLSSIPSTHQRQTGKFGPEKSRLPVAKMERKLRTEQATCSDADLHQAK